MTTTCKAEMRKLLVATALLSGLCTHANAAFVEDFAPDRWFQALGGGTIDSFDEASLSITGVYMDVFLLTPLAGRISFDWVYSTSADPMPVAFGISLDHPPISFTAVSDVNGSASQSGTYSVDVEASRTFSFSLRSFDGRGGPATTRISNFSFEPDAPVASVPEPSTVALLGLGLLGLGIRSRRKA